jgi:putative transposase
MLQDLLDEWPLAGWPLAGWQTRPHDALRDPLAPRRMLSPNEKYAALVAAAGYLPLTLTGEDYLRARDDTRTGLTAVGNVDQNELDPGTAGLRRSRDLRQGLTSRLAPWARPNRLGVRDGAAAERDGAAASRRDCAAGLRGTALPGRLRE